MVASPIPEPGLRDTRGARDDLSGENGLGAFGALARAAMALGSLGVILGVGWWSYGLAVRDPAEVPVIRALPEPIRERPARSGTVDRPDTPGLGEVQAVGRVPPPESEVVIAPADTPALPVEHEVEARKRNGTGSEATGTAVTRAGDALPPVTLPPPLESAAAVPASTASAAPAKTSVHAGNTPLSLPVKASPAASSLAAPGPTDPLAGLRPRARPRGLTRIAASAPAQPAAGKVNARPTTAKLVPGMAMVQLGAFASPEEAEAAWRRFRRREADLLADRPHHVLAYDRAGRRYYRLRLSGFEDFRAATRFCKAWAARGGECIPVIYK